MTVLPSPAIPANPSPQLQVVLKYLDAMGKRNFGALELLITDDYTHALHPDTLNCSLLEGKPAFIAFFKKMMEVYDDYTTFIKEIIEAPGKIVFHAVAESKLTTGYDYKNEQIGFAYTVEQPDGSYKISATKVFVDSKVAVDVTTHLKASGLPPPEP